jgi:hypothetical protein
MKDRLCPFRKMMETHEVRPGESYSEQHFMNCLGYNCMAFYTIRNFRGEYQDDGCKIMNDKEK